VFLSTEQIYNGRTDEGPFTEEDEPLCVTTYGNSKLETEAFLNGNIENRLILRLSTMFGLPMPGVRPSANAMTKAWNAMRTGTPAKFTPHEKRGMTYIMHLADHLEKLLELPSGTYHVSSANTMTTYERSMR
jgi:dTDP-4-dehydrorhamnose reductase